MVKRKKKRGKKLTELLSEIEEIDRRTRILDKRRANRAKRILSLLERHGKRSVVVTHNGRKVRVTRVSSSVPTWNQAGLRTWLQEHHPDAVKKVFRREEVFRKEIIDELYKDGVITEDEKDSLEQFLSFKERAPYHRVTTVRND